MGKMLPAPSQSIGKLEDIGIRNMYRPEYRGPLRKGIAHRLGRITLHSVGSS